jgi:hypothetical protein
MGYSDSCNSTASKTYRSYSAVQQSARFLDEALEIRRGELVRIDDKLKVDH